MRHRLENVATIPGRYAETCDVVLALVKLCSESQLVAGRLRAQGLGFVALVILVIYVPSWIVHALGMAR
jgi:hypothetical protein